MSVAPELRPCPDCRLPTRAPVVLEGMEVVRCQHCGKLRRRRRALTREQRAQALALRWAAAEIERDREVMMVNRRRKARGDPAELHALGKLAAAEQLHEWARTIHKRPPLTEVEGVTGGTVATWTSSPPLSISRQRWAASPRRGSSR